MRVRNMVIVKRIQDGIDKYGDEDRDGDGDRDEDGDIKFRMYDKDCKNENV